ncbi:MAG: hypothetical protein WCC56_08965 [Erwinia sp.]
MPIYGGWYTNIYGGIFANLIHSVAVAVAVAVAVVLYVTDARGAGDEGRNSERAQKAGVERVEEWLVKGEKCQSGWHHGQRSKAGGFR